MSSNAVLTTHNQTFQLRQVQSSNSIFLLQPHISSASDANELAVVPDLSIRAQCTATLELIPSPTFPVAWLKETLPIYNGPHEKPSIEYASASPGTMPERRSKRDHFANLPLSDDEFESGWRELCAFESDGQALRPSVLSLISVWKAIVSISTAQGINLGRNFQINDILDMFEEEDYPTSLVDTVLRNLTTLESVSSYSLSLDKEKCIRWVGATTLEAVGEQGTQVGPFLEAWRNELPELWRTAATLDALKVTHPG